MTIHLNTPKFARGDSVGNLYLNSGDTIKQRNSEDNYLNSGDSVKRSFLDNDISQLTLNYLQSASESQASELHKVEGYLKELSPKDIKLNQSFEKSNSHM